MARQWIKLASIVGIMAMPSSGSAAPITYSCHYTPNPLLSEFAAIDQIVVDRDARTIDLRDASTMGTSHQVNWVFRDAGNDDDRVYWREVGGEIAVSGTRFGLPFIFGSMGPLFGLSFADGLPFVYHEWDCRR